MGGGGDSVGCCFPARKESRQEVHWVVEAVVVAKASSGYESRQAGASAGAVSALAGPREFTIKRERGNNWTVFNGNFVQ